MGWELHGNEPFLVSRGLIGGSKQSQGEAVNM